MTKAYRDTMQGVTKRDTPSQRCSFYSRQLGNVGDQMTTWEVQDIKHHIDLARKQVDQHAKF